MQTIKWKRGKVIIICMVGILLYVCLKPRQYEFSTELSLPNTSPNAVWEFMADFNNMKLLNPTIIDFNIISEKGNYDHWQYVIEYTENLSHWPYLKNIAIAHISVFSEKEENFVIKSTHTTCMIAGMFCLNSIGEFTFSYGPNSLPKSTFCKENIHYECPYILKSYCRREVEFQRNAIMKNLKNYYKN